MTHAVIVQLLFAFFGSIGFAISFKVKGRHIILAGFGGFATWGVYLIANHFFNDMFMSNLIGAIFAAFFAEIMARFYKTPATIFLSIAAINLVPGGRLYYAMYGVINKDENMATINGEAAAIIAFAIAIGFVVVTIINRYIFRITRPAMRKVEVSVEKLRSEIRKDKELGKEIADNKENK